MRSHRVGTALLLLAALSLAGCADVSLRASRMRAEKLLYRARHEEERMRLGGAKPDSAGIARLRALYGKVRAEVQVPPADTTASVTTQRLRVALAVVVGSAELNGTRLALEANRPGEALEKARWLMTFAGQDTFLRREAHFRVIDALQGLGRYDDAVREMWATTEQYPPVAPRTPEEQDPILKMPGLVVMLHQQLGDSSAVPGDLRRGIAYFQGLLAHPVPPLLEAQVLVQLTRSETQLGDRTAALGSLDRLDHLVTATPQLRGGRAEVLCTKGDLQAVPGGNLGGALAAYNEVIKLYSNTPYAPRALIGAGVVEESQGKLREALARYKEVLDQYGSDSENGPIAMYRAAMLQEKLGDWVDAKQLLEAAPLRYPNTRVALEAPIGIVGHYQRTGDLASARAAFGKAIETYRRLVSSDSTSAMNVWYRWYIARCFAGLERWPDALAAIDEMSVKNRRSALTANALLEAARICGNMKNEERRKAYLRRYLADYPNGPDASRVRAMLGTVAGTPASRAGKAGGRKP